MSDHTHSDDTQSGNNPETDALIARARAGDEGALAELFEAYRARLRRMVDTRMDRRLRGRIDASDVLQEAYLHLAQKLEGYVERDNMSFFLWLRLVTGECLLGLHRHHLQTKKRDVGLEIALVQGPMPMTDSYSIAAQLLGKHTTASQKLMRAEAQLELEAALNGMEPIDREILVLRHFEELSASEAAAVLRIEPSAASNRYYRALRRLKRVLEE
ncbi:MAG: sigma-70 family RNA polymerase sigma factor [Planctomycetota bacterium]